MSYTSSKLLWSLIIRALQMGAFFLIAPSQQPRELNKQLLVSRWRLPLNEVQVMGRQFILGYFRLKQLKVTRPERNAKLAASSTSSRRWRRGPWTENPWKMVNHRFCDAKRNWKRNDNDRCCKTARSNFIYKSSAIFLSDEVSLHILCYSAQFFCKCSHITLLKCSPTSNETVLPE